MYNYVEFCLRRSVSMFSRLFSRPTGYDRTTTNDSDGQIFYGYDQEDGTTDWYDKNNTLDCNTPTPDDDDF